MTVALSLSHLLLGVGAAHAATRRLMHAAILEWVGGIALVIGLASLGFGLAQYSS